ncbi:MAG TPA: CFI-box-CTERM domain-containing protein [Gemmatimonadales bacterium]|nr:CFI-box-CTERM domain-containing protein [Gemmatimonadales bacterium]
MANLGQIMDGNAQSDPCFIATAAFGATDTNVSTLRAYRNEVLQRSLAGRLTIRLYYATSPRLARFIERSSRRRAAVRVVLRPFVNLAERALERRHDP